MLKKISFFVIFVILLSLRAVTPAFAVSYRNEIVIDQISGKVYSAQNQHKRLPMASTTKVVTALIVIENVDLNKIITVDKESAGTEGSSIYLVAGEQLTAKELLYGLMLQSGNDCAMTLARNSLSGYDEFIRKMNERAAMLGLTNTHFTNPHGLHDDNHYTSCYDLAMLTKDAMNNPTFREIVSTKSIQIGNRHIVNKNKMLRGFEGGTGVKTGYTKRAGRCLVSSATRGDISLIAVVINCGDMWERSKGLMDEVFYQYDYKVFASPDDVISINLFGSQQKVRCRVNNLIAKSIVKNEANKYRTEIKLYKKLIPPLKNEENIGDFLVYYENCLIFSEKIYTIDSVTNYTDFIA